MTVTENKFVTINYTFKSSEGTLLGSSERSGPLTFRHGVGDVIPGLEKALYGLEIGSKKSFSIIPEEAYGSRDESLTTQITKADLPEGLEPKIGTRLSWALEGQTRVFLISDIQGDSITIDGNHPLAGVSLDFEVEVIHVGEEDPFAHDHGGCGCGSGGCGSGGGCEH